MTRRIGIGAAIAVQGAGVAAFVYGGFLVCAALGWVLFGCALALIGLALEREVS